MEYRPLGNTGIRVSAVALGCWPIAGMTSPGVDDQQSIATIRECFDLGINHLDTAYMYGLQGESERLIAQAVGSRRDEMVIATKGGLHWDSRGRRVPDARPATLRRECEESLRRLATDHVELYYLHAFDPKTPLAESAGEMKRLVEQGKARAIGVSNLTLDQIKQFTAHCPIAACQPSYSMVDRGIENDVLPWCQAGGIAVVAYWVLFKGLLAGHLRRDDVLPEGDKRRNYAMFQGDEWRKNQDLLDRLRRIAAASDHTVAQVAVNWVLHRPGITAALCGAKRPEQIRETAGSSGWRLDAEQLAEIDRALEARGEPNLAVPN